MKKFIKKYQKPLMLGALFLAVIAAGFANYFITTGAANNAKDELPANAENYSDVGVKPSNEENAVDVFSSYRDERETTRAQEINYIESVVTSAEVDAATKEEAQKQKLSLVANMEHELTAEGVIKTKLGMDAIVTVKEGTVNIVVDKKELSNNEVAQIAEIVKSQTGENAKNIKIMPRV